MRNNISTARKKTIHGVPCNPVMQGLSAPVLAGYIGDRYSLGAAMGETRHTKVLIIGSQAFRDEVAAAVWLDPSLATRRETMMVDVDTAFTANYGGVLSWPEGRGPGLGERAVDVVLDIDVQRMERLTLELLGAKGTT